jgi:hypothetical protein
MLTDGSVITHDTCTPSWFRLLPRGDGTFANMYINGDWSATASGDNAALAPMIGTGAAPDSYGPLYFASVVLPDGRFIINGGEGENSTGSCQTSPTPADSTKGSLFDPNANSWTSVPPPGQGGANPWATIGDAQGILLGGNNITGAYSAASYALQNCCDSTGPQAFEMAVASITPRPGTTVTWTQLSTGKVSANNEEGWVRLPNGELLTVATRPCAAPPGACNPTAAERFVPGANPPTWVSAGNTTTTLVSQNPGSETGPGVGIGFNMVVWFGSVNAIQLFRYPGTNNNWFAQTTFPATPPPATCTLAAGQTQAVADGPASLLPSGNILVQTSPVPGFNAPSCFWEFQSSTLSPSNTGPAAPTATVNQPQCNSGTANTTNVQSYKGRILLLPTGQVLWDAGGGVYVTGSTRGPGSPPCVYVYASNTTTDPNPVMRPVPHINSISNSVLTRGNNNYVLTGSMFRGVSQGASYGDDGSMATDFPIVMITNNATGNRCFGRTHDWQNTISTQFDLPPATTPAAGWALVQRACDTTGGGASTLVVIVNGKQSNPIAVTVN